MPTRGRFALFAVAAFLIFVDRRWPRENRLNFATKCVVNNMRNGTDPKVARFYCECVANEYEKVRTAEWAEAPDGDPADDKLEADTSTLCTERTYAQFPEAR